MKFELDSYHRNISDKELLKDVSQIAKSLNKDVITTREYKKKGGKYSIDTFCRKFGSWNAVLKEIGLNESLVRNIATEDLFKNLEEVWIRMGRCCQRCLYPALGNF